MRKTVWRYLQGGKVKHAIEGNFTSGRCGTGPVWHDAAGWMGNKAAADKLKLTQLTQCARCRRLLAKDEQLRSEAK